MIVVRSLEPELMDDPALPEGLLEQTHRGLERIHGWLGNRRAILKALRHGPQPVGRVLDIGCGRGALLAEIRRKLGVEVIGVELRVPRDRAPEVPILCADAIRDPLPPADVAIALFVAHHFDELELIELIRNVGRASRRLLLVDPVRHPVPLWLFRGFVAPLVPAINAADGAQSIRRSYTPPELRAIVAKALAGSRAGFRHSVAWLRSRQIVDIHYGRTEGS